MVEVYPESEQRQPPREQQSQTLMLVLPVVSVASSSAALHQPKFERDNITLS
jgi:hypothetical protein